MSEKSPHTLAREVSRLEDKIESLNGQIQELKQQHEERVAWVTEQLGKEGFDLANVHAPCWEDEASLENFKARLAHYNDMHVRNAARGARLFRIFLAGTVLFLGLMVADIIRGWPWTWWWPITLALFGIWRGFFYHASDEGASTSKRFLANLVALLFILSVILGVAFPTMFSAP